ncbi:Secreted beta-glucosidase sun1 [Gurleya vavrai]
MQRRRTLKVIKTPDNSILPQTDNTLFFETPRGKLKPKNEKSFDETSFISDKIEETKLKIEAKSFFDFCKKYFTIAFLFVFFVVSMYNNNKKINTQIKFLERKINELEIKKEKIEEEKILDFASVENGASIDYKNTSPVYSSGIFQNNKGKDASNVLLSSFKKGECFSFNGFEGKLSIKFEKKIKINEIKIFHPFTDNRKSAIKNFKLIGFIDNKEFLIGDFIYKIDAELLQSFKIANGEKFDKICIVIENNHGHEKYTCVYKVSIMGSV